MGRMSVLLGFWALGLVLGIVFYYVFPGISHFISIIPALLAAKNLGGAMVSGLAGSFIFLAGIMLWGRISRQDSP